MKKFDERRFETCLGEHEIETYLLQPQVFQHLDESRISAHIKTCYDCFNLYFDLRNYHQILSAELAKPISRQIIDLVKGLQDNEEIV